MSVNEKKRGRPKTKQSQLSAEVILSEAKSMMRTDGKIPSIRKLAVNLNVDAMAIYHYFTNKNSLLESITVSLIGDIYQPIESEDWQTELHKLCHSYVSLLHDYPGLLETLLTMNSVSPAQVFIQRFERIISPLGLSSTSIKNTLDLLADYLHGFVLALNCNQGATLSMDALSGPLTMVFLALKHADKNVKE